MLRPPGRTPSTDALQNASMISKYAPSSSEGTVKSTSAYMLFINCLSFIRPLSLLSAHSSSAVSSTSSSLYSSSSSKTWKTSRLMRLYCSKVSVSERVLAISASHHACRPRTMRGCWRNLRLFKNASKVFSSSFANSRPASAADATAELCCLRAIARSSQLKPPLLLPRAAASMTDMAHLFCYAVLPPRNSYFFMFTGTTRARGAEREYVVIGYSLVQRTEPRRAEFGPLNVEEGVDRWTHATAWR